MDCPERRVSNCVNRRRLTFGIIIIVDEVGHELERIAGLTNDKDDRASNRKVESVRAATAYRAARVLRPHER